MKHAFKLFAIVPVIAISCAPVPKSPGEVVDDTWIHTKVKTQLVGYGTSNINIEVDRGVVQLAGFVASETEREAAGKQAASVKGVKRVSNKLQLEPRTRTAGRALDDGVLAGKVKAALADDSRTSALDVNVEVRHGVVLLSGFVASNDARKAALDVAGDTPNVVDVIDGMDIRPAG